MVNEHWYYDSPLTKYEKEIARNINEQFDSLVMQNVIEVGVDIDKDKLIQALTADQNRYVDAYNRGWEACMKHYGITDDA